MSESITKAALKTYLINNRLISGSTYQQIANDLGLITHQTMTVTLKFDVTDIDPMGDSWNDGVDEMSRRFDIDLEDLDGQGVDITVTVEDK